VVTSVFELCGVMLSNTNYMKHQNFFLRLAFLAVVFLGIQSFVPARSQKLIASNTAISKVQFVGMDGDMLVFDLQLSNRTKGSWLRIMDENKNVLFEQRINAATYAKRYKIVRNDLKAVHFEVINKETILKKSFQLKYRLEEKMEVIKA